MKSNQIEFSNCPRLVPEYGNVAGELAHVEEEGQEVEELGAVRDDDLELLVGARHVEEDHPVKAK